MLVSADEIIEVVKPHLRDDEQATRIRDLFGRFEAAYEKSGAQGIKASTDSDRGTLQSKLESAIAGVKRDAGLR